MIPDDLRRARGALGVRVVGVVPERARRDAAGLVARRDFVVSAAVSGDVRWGAVLDIVGVMVPVTEWMVQH